MFKRMLSTTNYVTQRFISAGIVLYAVYLLVHAVHYYTRYGNRLIYTPYDVVRAGTYPLIFLCFGIAGLLPPRWIKTRISLWVAGAMIALMWLTAIVRITQQMPF